MSIAVRQKKPCHVGGGLRGRRRAGLCCARTAGQAEGVPTKKTPKWQRDSAAHAAVWVAIATAPAQCGQQSRTNPEMPGRAQQHTREQHGHGGARRHRVIVHRVSVAPYSRVGCQFCSRMGASAGL